MRERHWKSKLRALRAEIQEHVQNIRTHLDFSGVFGNFVQAIFLAKATTYWDLFLWVSYVVPPEPHSVQAPNCVHARVISRSYCDDLHLTGQAAL